MFTEFVLQHAGVLELKPNDKIYTELRKSIHAGIRKAVVDHMGHLRRTVRQKNAAVEENQAPVEERSNHS